MRILVAGASGAIGSRLVAQLVDHGHDVIGTHRNPANADRVSALGAVPVELDLLDPGAVRAVVLAAAPDAIVHQATALSDMTDFKHFDRSFAQTNRLRTEGTDALLAAADEAGVGRFVAQSFASARYERAGGPVKTEDDPLDPTPVPAMRESDAAMRHLDRVVTEAGGIALRYGGFYGAANDGMVEPVRKRMFPIVGDGGGVMSFIHLDDAAAATVLALDHDGGGIFNIVDDDPAPTREWLPVLAEVLGAKPPRHVPRWLAKLVAGEAAVMLGTVSRGASNAKARRELGWEPRYPSWRQGFVAAYAAAPAPSVPLREVACPVEVLRQRRIAVVLDVAGAVDAHVQPVAGADVGVAGPVHVDPEAAGRALQGDVGRAVRADVEGVDVDAVGADVARAGRVDARQPGDRRLHDRVGVTEAVMVEGDVQGAVADGRPDVVDDLLAGADPDALRLADVDAHVDRVGVVDPGEGGDVARL